MSVPAPHVFSDDYYARLAELEERHWWSAGIRDIQRTLLRQLPRRADGWRVLDAGCGTGLTMTWARQFTRHEPVGLDRALSGLQFCRKRGLRRLIEGDATIMPVPDGCFDLALSCDVIQHLPRPDGDAQALRELHRALASGGHLLLRTNSRCGYPPDEPAPDYHRYSVAEVREKLHEAGFTDVRVSYVNCLPALAVTLLRRARGQAPTGSDPGLSLRLGQPRWMRALLYSTLRCEALLLGLGGSVPFGHSIIALARKA